MSTQTEHIGLHQWENTDPFLREDFNEDNRKIDEAVGEVAAVLPLEPLFDVTVQEAVSVVSLEMTGIDRSKYHELLLYGEISGRENLSATFLLQIDGLNGAYYSSDRGNSEQGIALMDVSSKPGVIMAHMPCACQVFGAYGYATSFQEMPMEFRGTTSHLNRRDWEDVAALELRLKNTTYADGCKFKLYGVKKI